MNKKLLLFFSVIAMAYVGAVDAVTIKKAASVETKKQTTEDVGATLVPTVMGLVTSVQQINQQQQALTEECRPSGREVEFVNDIIKEWAKTGAASADEVQQRLGMRRCSSPSGGYQTSVQIAAGEDDGTAICYDYFNDPDMVWDKFPVVVSTYYCTDGSISGCSNKSRKDVSNIYDVFNLIDFSDADYTKDELELAKKLEAKMEKCSGERLAAQKKALWSDLVVNTIGGVGQKTNTGSIMQTVSGAANSGISGVLGSFGSVASQFMQ